MQQPIVSVVIPTRGRPHLLGRAVASALTQSLTDIEVIVVIDGPDDATVALLAQYSDDRLRVVALPESRGGSGARNAGVRAACAQWIAFLDDDDEWLSTKLEKQLRRAAGSGVAHPIVSCLSRVVTPSGEYRWPTRLPRPDEAISDYLFVRKSLFQGEGFVGTPTILTSRALMLEVPFTPGLKRHQDWDWLLRACARPDVQLDYVDEQLVVLYMEERRPGISSSNDWRYSLEWARRSRSYFSAAAYAAFLLTVVSSIAARERARTAFRTLLFESFRSGAPNAHMTALFLGMWMLPESTRRQLRGALSRART